MDKSGGVLGCYTGTAQTGNVALAFVSVLPINDVGGRVGSGPWHGSVFEGCGVNFAKLFESGLNDSTMLHCNTGTNKDQMATTYSQLDPAVHISYR